MFFPLHFWGVNNMYWESEGGEFLHPWRKGGLAGGSSSIKLMSVIPADTIKREANTSTTTIIINQD